MLLGLRLEMLRVRCDSVVQRSCWKLITTSRSYDNTQAELEAIKMHSPFFLGTTVKSHREFVRS